MLPTEAWASGSPEGPIWKLLTAIGVGGDDIERFLLAAWFLLYAPCMPECCRPYEEELQQPPNGSDGSVGSDLQDWISVALDAGLSFGQVFFHWRGCTPEDLTEKGFIQNGFLDALIQHYSARVKGGIHKDLELPVYAGLLRRLRPGGNLTSRIR